MEDKEEYGTGLALVDRPRAMAVASPMEALALMSDAEFEARLASLKKGQDRLAMIQRSVMIEGTDYGTIPGTPKPTLLKPGAEKLCKFHHLVPTLSWQTIIGDGVTAPHIRVLMTCSLHVDTDQGPIVGQGVGTANSWEKKYRYRDAQRVCPDCGQPSISKSKEEWGGGWYCNQKRGGCGAKFKKGDASIEAQVLGQIENPDPYDGENTLVKMAAKRAQVDATLRVTATSGLFTQDLEDVTVAPDEVRPSFREGPGKPAAAAVLPPEGPPAEPSAREQRIIRWKELREAVKERSVPVIALTVAGVKQTKDEDIEEAIIELERVLKGLDKQPLQKVITGEVGGLR